MSEGSELLQAILPVNASKEETLVRMATDLSKGEYPNNSVNKETLTNFKPIRLGYTFLGWSTSPSATTATYQAGATIPAEDITSDMTLYAVWQSLWG